MKNAPDEPLASGGCEIEFRRLNGPVAREIFIRCRTNARATGAGAQAAAVYSAIRDFLASEGADFSSVASETIFLRDADRDVDTVRVARQRLLTEDGAEQPPLATTEIQQPPVDGGAELEVAMHAVLPNDARSGSFPADVIDGEPACGCGACTRPSATMLSVGPEIRFQAADLIGAGEDAHAQTLAMFEAADELLRRAGLTFDDVVRTWIRLRDIDCDYAAFNHARRTFFESRGIDPVPASTGIGGRPVPPAHALSLGLQAVRSDPPHARSVMTSPTLNEAGTYGADFVRGMKVVEANKIALHISGTASIDEAGATAHPGDFDAQVDRMLRNVSTLLERQGATFADVVSAITYVKHVADAGRLKEKFLAAGYIGFPNVIVRADVCRPELLCETEALAVLPTTGHAESTGE